MKVLPGNSIVLVAHEHFGIDLAPGLSIKLNAAFVSDVLDIAGVDGTGLKVVRQEFGGTGERARPLRPFNRRGHHASVRARSSRRQALPSTAA